MWTVTGWPANRKHAIMTKLKQEKSEAEELVSNCLKRTNLGALLGLSSKDVLWGLSNVSIPKLTFLYR